MQDQSQQPAYYKEKIEIIHAAIPVVVLIVINCWQYNAFNNNQNFHKMSSRGQSFYLHLTKYELRLESFFREIIIRKRNDVIDLKKIRLQILSMWKCQSSRTEKRTLKKLHFMSIWKCQSSKTKNKKKKKKQQVI